MHYVKNLHEYTQIDLSTSQSFIVKKNTQILSGIETSTRYNIWQNKLHCHVFWGFFFIETSVSQDIPYSQQNSVNPKSNNVLKFHPLCNLANGCAKYQHWPLRSMSTFEHHRWIIGTLEHWINGILEHWLRQISTLTSVSTLEHPPPDLNWRGNSTSMSSATAFMGFSIDTLSNARKNYHTYRFSIPSLIYKKMQQK